MKPHATASRSAPPRGAAPVPATGARPGAGSASRPDAREDARTVERVLEGTTDLFERLVTRHQRPLLNYVYRMIGDYEQSVDMVQDVFTKAYFALDRYDPRYRFSTWLYRIAANSAIDFLRRQRLQTVSLDQPLETDSGPLAIEPRSRACGPAEQFEYRETARRLSRAVDALPPEYRQLILLRHVHHLRYDEIAAVCDLPLGTVKNRIFRARGILRRRLERP